MGGEREIIVPWIHTPNGPHSYRLASLIAPDFWSKFSFLLEVFEIADETTCTSTYPCCHLRNIKLKRMILYFKGPSFPNVKQQRKTLNQELTSLLLTNFLSPVPHVCFNYFVSRRHSKLMPHWTGAETLFARIFSRKIGLVKNMQAVESFVAKRLHYACHNKTCMLQDNLSFDYLKLFYRQ